MVNKCYRSNKAFHFVHSMQERPQYLKNSTLTYIYLNLQPIPTTTINTLPSSTLLLHILLQRDVCLYLPSDSSRGRSSLYMRTGLRVRRTVAAGDGRGRGGGSGGRSRTADPDEHRMHRTRLHLAAADDSLRSTAAGFATTAAALRALIHVQLTRLYGTAATSRGGTATPGTLYASPHPLHSTTGVRLTIGHPPHTTVTRDGARARKPLRSSPRGLGRARLPVTLRGMKSPFGRPTEMPRCVPVHAAASLQPTFVLPSFHERTNPGVYPE